MTVKMYVYDLITLDVYEVYERNTKEECWDAFFIDEWCLDTYSLSSTNFEEINSQTKENRQNVKTTA